MPFLFNLFLFSCFFFLWLFTPSNLAPIARVPFYPFCSLKIPLNITSGAVRLLDAGMLFMNYSKNVHIKEVGVQVEVQAELGGMVQARRSQTINHNGVQTTSGFEMCFAIGPQHQSCRGSQPIYVSHAAYILCNSHFSFCSPLFFPRTSRAPSRNI